MYIVRSISMALTKTQKESIQEVVGYLNYDTELNSLTNSMDEDGFTDEQITKFLSMSRGRKIKFMEKNELTYHVFYRMLILLSIK
jgi:hypothetical protein